MATTLPSAQDQYMLELINRGRANPQAEADRYLDGINGRDGDLNQGVRARDTITTDAKQPLAFNLNLNTATEDHAQWLLDENKFQHRGEGGTNSRQRMQAAGYTFTNPSGNGENLAWLGTTGTPNLTTFVRRNYENLFIDKDYRNRGHRVTLMNDDFQEIGISSLQGRLTSGGRTFNAVMSAQNFAYSAASGPFITGVAYTDAVTDDDFYTVGEGIGGITVTAVDTENSANTFTTTTWESGGYSLDVDPNATYDVTFSGDLDGDGQADDTATYEVTVGSENVKQDVVSDNLPSSTPTNSAPTAVEIDNDTIAENSNNNTVVGNLTTSDSDAGDTHTYELLNDANGRFALDGDQIVVADGSKLDFESNETHNITVRTTDDGGESFNQRLTINVSNVDETPPNSAPTAVEIDNDTIAENSNNNTVVGNLTTSDSDAGDTHTYELLNDANGRFALDGDQIVVADGSKLDFESNETHNITVRTTDDGGESFNQRLTINVSNVDETPPNSAPTAVEIDNDTIAENSNNNTVVGNLTTSDSDAGDTHTYELLNDANGRFALDGDQIVVADGSKLDFESNETHNITVRTTDDGGESFEQRLTINVSNVDETPPNSAPTAVEIDNDTIAENSNNNTVVGNLTTSDSDAGDTHTYELLNDANGRFALDGDQIVVADGSKLDFESDETHNITVRTTDDGGESFNQQLTINLSDVDETPPELENFRTMYGGDRNDRMRGTIGNDFINGEGGNDVLIGRPGDDLLNGGLGNDQLRGGSGNDTLIGVDITSAQPGYNERDVLQGSADADLFILGDDSQVYYIGNGVKDYARIETFNGDQGDQIQLSGSSGDYTLEENVSGLPTGTAIYNNDDLVGIVRNVRNMDLNSSDFSFV
ncbi:cadherin domain-containing protein [Okeania sp. KiyG1]|uniref:cadherin domain-containing protein n=1 Tax=Okeania sp. KiyG1 TaxID=2720165 RepID=UPI0019226AC5|nr:cadherin domain-containing protein [Okeania sp. KiyG1]GGA41024.1 hypothetical protein CYANOKiyG1_59390 [Okeania sp. KiyG1]